MDLDKIMDLIRGLLKYIEQTGITADDWACKKCKPDSDMLRHGFLCSVHTAELVLLNYDFPGNTPPKPEDQ